MRDTDDRHRYEQAWRMKRYGDDARSGSSQSIPRDERVCQRCWHFLPGMEPHPCATCRCEVPR